LKRPKPCRSTRSLRSTTVRSTSSMKQKLQSILMWVIPGPNNPWMPEDMVITGSWVWLHLITEVARHAGHADLIRETTDGKISYQLNFLADGGTEEEWAAEVAAYWTP